MEKTSYIETLVANAAKAQQELETFTQQQVDALVRTLAKVVYDNAVELARMAADETAMGVFEDKIKKNQGKARILWNDLKTKKSVGILREDHAAGIVEVAKPMGVVGAVTPCTNPIVTPMCNAMFALKGRNSMIIAPHPRAKKCARYLNDLWNEALRQLGAPEHCIQTIDEPSVDLTKELMRSVDVVVATGGMGMVKAAYSSGKPAYGVGAGNVQCILDRGMDVKEAVEKIIVGRTFDNGIICSGEQTVIAPQDEYEAIMAEFQAQGGYYTEDADEVARLREVLFPTNSGDKKTGGQCSIMNKNLVGQPVEDIAKAAGITLPEGTRVILVKADGIGDADALSKEKMCSVLSTYAYADFDEAVQIAHANLDVEGKGHTVAIHSHNTAHIEYASQALPVSRILVNQIGATMNGGSFFNSLTPTTTLGCGSWGNNSISENFGYKHLLNITRIAYRLDDAVAPTDEEIWS